MAMDDFLLTEQQMDPAQALQLQQEVQRLEQDRQTARRPLSAIVRMENQGESDLSQEGYCFQTPPFWFISYILFC